MDLSATLNGIQYNSGGHVGPPAGGALTAAPALCWTLSTFPLFNDVFALDQRSATFNT